MSRASLFMGGLWSCWMNRDVRWALPITYWWTDCILLASLRWNFRSGKYVSHSGSTVLWGGMFSSNVNHIRDFVNCKCRKNDLPLIMIKRYIIFLFWHRCILNFPGCWRFWRATERILFPMLKSNKGKVFWWWPSEPPSRGILLSQSHIRYVAVSFNKM